MRETDRFVPLAIAAALSLAAASLSFNGCSARPEAGFHGAWAYWSNGMPGVERYLLVEKSNSGPIVFLVDAAKGELEGWGRAEPKGRTLVASMGQGVFLDLELNGNNELRAAMRKPAQTEDLTFVFYRADSPGAGKGVP